jgi:hypothetical protein
MKLLASVLAIMLSFLVIACGDDDNSPSTATPEIPGVLATPTVAPGGGPGTPLPPDTEPGTPVPATGSTDSFVFPASPDPATQPSLLTDVRVGAHPENGGFDRIVFEFEAGQRPSGIVGYKDEVSQCGSGAPVNPAGSHILAVHLDFTNAHTEAGQLSIPSTTVDGPGNSILESISTCDFEAVVEWAVGTDGEKPFTVTLLDGPVGPRIVIDVAH